MRFSIGGASLLFSLFSCDVCLAASLNATSELIEHLFKDYNAQASPYAANINNVGDPSSIQSVALRLSRAIIASVNERDWTISIFLTANYKWRDPRLVWDPATADGISQISMKSDTVWQPDVYPCESTKVGPVLKDLPPTSVSIHFDGSVRMDANQVVNYICQMKASHDLCCCFRDYFIFMLIRKSRCWNDFDAFPFDAQQCSICFSLDGPSGLFLTLDDVSQHPIELRSNSEWDVVRNLTKDEARIVQDGMQSHRPNFSIVPYQSLAVSIPIVPYQSPMPPLALALVTIESVNRVTGIVANAMLLYAIQRFSGALFGTYKHLLTVFTLTDGCLVILHEIVHPRVLATDYMYGIVTDTVVDDKRITALFVAFQSVPFTLLGIHFLYRYWSIRRPHLIRLFSTTYFLLTLILVALGAITTWYSIGLYGATELYATECKQEMMTEYETKFGKRIENSWLFYDHWRDNQFNRNLFVLICVKNTIMISSLCFVSSLAFFTFRHIKTSAKISAKAHKLQRKLLIALCAQATVPFLFVYIPFLLCIDLPFFKITISYVHELSVPLTTFFPVCDAVIVILLISDYRRGLMGMIRNDPTTNCESIGHISVIFHFSLVRRAFFWIFLIIIPTFLFCLVTLVGVYFYEGDDAVQSAASIGLTTMTSLMLVVTILSDDLDKSDNLPGLGWFVFVEIVVVCVSVIVVLIVDGARSLALNYRRRNKDACLACLRILTSKRLFRALRVTLFLLSITALVLNAILCWT